MTGWDQLAYLAAIWAFVVVDRESTQKDRSDLRPKIWWRVLFPAASLIVGAFAIVTGEVIAYVLAGAILINFVGPLTGVVIIHSDRVERRFPFGILRDEVVLSDLRLVDVKREERGRAFPKVLKLEDGHGGRLVLELWLWDGMPALVREIARAHGIEHLATSDKSRRRLRQLTRQG
jgi:hypothetical protein